MWLKEEEKLSEALTCFSLLGHVGLMDLKSELSHDTASSVRILNLFSVIEIIKDPCNHTITVPADIDDQIISE